MLNEFESGKERCRSSLNSKLLLRLLQHKKQCRGNINSKIPGNTAPAERTVEEQSQWPTAAEIYLVQLQCMTESHEPHRLLGSVQTNGDRKEEIKASHSEKM